MTKKELLDSVYALHVLISMVLINANSDLIALLNSMDTSRMSYRGPGFLGIAILIGGLIVCYGAIAFHRLRELPLLCLVFLVALFLQMQALNILYLIAASIACLVWFFYKRNPPLI